MSFGAQLTIKVILFLPYGTDKNDKGITYSKTIENLIDNTVTANIPISGTYSRVKFFGSIHPVRAFIDGSCVNPIIDRRYG
jgi:hypothetical protein